MSGLMNVTPVYNFLFLKIKIQTQSLCGIIVNGR